MNSALRFVAILLPTAVLGSLAKPSGGGTPGRPGFVVPALEYVVRFAAGGLVLLLTLRGRIAPALVSAGGVTALLLVLALLVPGESNVMDPALHAGIEGVAVGILAGVTLYVAERAGVVTFPWR